MKKSYHHFELLKVVHYMLSTFLIISLSRSNVTMSLVLKYLVATSQPIKHGILNSLEKIAA